jgi:hypothetical protein
MTIVIGFVLPVVAGVWMLSNGFMTLRFGHGTVTTLPRRADPLAAGIFISGHREA